MVVVVVVVVVVVLVVLVLVLVLGDEEVDPGAAVVVVVVAFVVVVLDPPGAVVVVDAEARGATTATPKGEAPDGPAEGTSKGFDGEPAWVAPTATSAMKIAPAATAPPSVPKYTGRARAARRSRLASLRRRASRSGGRWPRWSSHDMNGAQK